MGVGGIFVRGKEYFCVMENEIGEIKISEVGIANRYMVPCKRRPVRGTLSPSQYLRSLLKNNPCIGEGSILVRIGIGLKWNVIDFEKYRGDIEWFLWEMSCEVKTIDVVGRFLFIELGLPVSRSCRSVAYGLRGYLGLVLGIRSKDWTKYFYCQGIGGKDPEGMIKWMRGNK